MPVSKKFKRKYSASPKQRVRLLNLVNYKAMFFESEEQAFHALREQFMINNQCYVGSNYRIFKSYTLKLERERNKWMEQSG